MQDVDMEGRVAGAQQQQQQQQAAGLMDTLLSLIPGRKAQVANEPSDDSIKRTHEFLRYGVLHCSLVPGGRNRSHCLLGVPRVWSPVALTVMSSLVLWLMSSLKHH